MSRAAALNRSPLIVLGLSADEAAEAIGVGKTVFLQMVEDGRMPRPRVINARRVFDIDEVRTAFRALPHDAEPTAAEPDQWDGVRA